MIRATLTSAPLVALPLRLLLQLLPLIAIANATAIAIAVATAIAIAIVTDIPIAFAIAIDIATATAIATTMTIARNYPNGTLLGVVDIDIVTCLRKYPCIFAKCPRFHHKYIALVLVLRDDFVRAVCCV